MDFALYVKQIDEFPDEYFDIILIDGRARPSCIKRSVSKVKPGGLLILDNSEREYYLAKAIEYLKAFQRNEFYGLVSSVPVISKTDIFIR
jgi:predicted O-methyltransferase YrrM